MPRATNAPASRERRKRMLEKAKGFRGRRSKLFRYAKNAVMKAEYWSYRDRKTRKRNFRYLWIQRINAAARANGLTYRSEEHTSELQSPYDLVCRLLLEKKNHPFDQLPGAYRQYASSRTRTLRLS